MLLARVARRPVLPPTLAYARALCQPPSTSREIAIRLRNSAKLLGVRAEATPKEIKVAYYKLARTTHPDILGVPKEAAGPAPVAESFDIGVLDDPAGPPSVVRFLEVRVSQSHADWVPNTGRRAHPAARGRCKRLTTR